MPFGLSQLIPVHLPLTEKVGKIHHALYYIVVDSSPNAKNYPGATLNNCKCGPWGRIASWPICKRPFRVFVNFPAEPLNGGAYRFLIRVSIKVSG
jgi:hypothetical protein